MADSPVTLIRFVAPPNDRVSAPQAGYVVGLLDVAGYAVRGVLPDDSLDFARAVKIMRITQHDRLIVRERDGAPAHSAEVFVALGSDERRPAESRVRASGAGTKDDPIVHECDPIATGRAILHAADLHDAPLEQR